MKQLTMYRLILVVIGQLRHKAHVKNEISGRSEANASATFKTRGLFLFVLPKPIELSASFTYSGVIGRRPNRVTDDRLSIERAKL